MRTSWLGAACVAVWLSLPSAAQSVPQLFEKGIYAQETAGDLDSAIRIYRQITASAAEFRKYAAQAQYRLAQCLLDKGAKEEAGKAFEVLLRDYPGETALAARAHESMGELSGFVGRDYQEARLGISFTLPPNWNVDNVGYWDQNALEGTVYLRTPCCTPPPSQPAVWAKSVKTAPQDILPHLRESPRLKAAHRTGNWTVRPESIRERLIGGAHTVSCVADFNMNGARMAEYLVWVDTEDTRALFFAKVPAGELESHLPEYDKFVDTIRLR